MEESLEILEELKFKIDTGDWRERDKYRYTTAIDNLIWECEHQKRVIERYRYVNECLEKGIEHEGKIIQETKNTVAHINLFHDLFGRK